ncbi:hypothetical protein [Angustibacter aerolatus]
MVRDTDRDSLDDPDAGPLNAAEQDPVPEKQDGAPDHVPDAPVGEQDPVDGTGYHEGAEQVPGDHGGPS